MSDAKYLSRNEHVVCIQKWWRRQTLLHATKDQVNFETQSAFEGGPYFYHVQDQKHVYRFEPCALYKFVTFSDQKINPYTKVALKTEEVMRLRRLALRKNPNIEKEVPQRDVPNNDDIANMLDLTVMQLAILRRIEQSMWQAFERLQPRESRRPEAPPQANAMQRYFEEHPMYLMEFLRHHLVTLVRTQQWSRFAESVHAAAAQYYYFLVTSMDSNSTITPNHMVRVFGQNTTHLFEFLHYRLVEQPLTDRTDEWIRFTKVISSASAQYHDYLSQSLSRSG